MASSQAIQAAAERLAGRIDPHLGYARAADHVRGYYENLAADVLVAAAEHLTPEDLPHAAAAE